MTCGLTGGTRKVHAGQARAFDTLAEKSMIVYSAFNADLIHEANYVGKRENKRICSRTRHRPF